MYERQRQEYLTDIQCPPITSNLLNGNEHLTFEQNKHIFLQVQHFIASTKRF